MTTNAKQLKSLIGDSCEIFPMSKDGWQAAHLTHVTASGAAAALGALPYKSAYAQYAEMAGLVEAPDLDDNEKVQWGTRLESAIAEQTAKVLGVEMLDPGRHTLLISKEFPGLACTLDRLIVPRETRGAGVAEIKNVGPPHPLYAAGSWEDEPPLWYQIQLHVQLVVTGLSWGVLSALIGGQRLQTHEIQAGGAFRQRVIPELARFHTNTLKGIAPEVDGSDSTRAALAVMWPEDTGESKELPWPMQERADWLWEAKREIAIWEARKTEEENYIRAAMGGAKYGVLPNGEKLCTLGTVNVKERTRTVAAYSYRRLTMAKRKAEEQTDG